MTDNIPVHLRITKLTPSNDDVDTFRAAVSDLATAWNKLRPLDALVAKAVAIAESLGAGGEPSVEFGTEVQTIVQKRASAFLYADNPLEVGICAGMAVVLMLKVEPGTHGWTTMDVYSNALWSALAFQPVLKEEKRENLRREVLSTTLQRSMISAEKARERDAIAESTDLIVTIGDDGKVSTNFKKAAQSAIEALRRNATLVREEIDFLWWSLLNRSRLLNKPLAQISEASRLVASGIEASGHLRRLPAEVHRDLVLRTVEADPKLNLAELLAEIGDDRQSLLSGIQAQQVTAYPAVFPLLNAIVTGDPNCNGAEEKRSASTWGSRALLEGALSRMMTVGILSK